MTRIRFFALLRERLGVSEWHYAQEKPVDVEALIRILKAESLAWETELNAQEVLVAVNQALVERSFIVNPGDEVALFPPVTGG
ncbi:MoaD/ThiS family protein [Aliidiomarina sanyensis]|uniref:Molybdopterin synthase sulfur carrier subunit n=1 Tax=Aliidiomarina sanyensis TaxID=1249555 RepID=A0A432WRD6_9GAMM|nr:MoaD/ThiS family protein [Aliidiomarina sanyensis]RUO36372.1 molybdopterin synthase sulfur carrier subunit [Aliidiomarina sanyensis]